MRHWIYHCQVKREFLANFHVNVKCPKLIKTPHLGLTNFTVRYYFLYCVSPFTAPGIGISIILTRALVGSYFDKHYAVANAIGGLGYASGFIFIGPLTQFLLDNYGWKGALAMLGALSLNLGACGGLLQPPQVWSAVVKRDQYM